MLGGKYYPQCSLLLSNSLHNAPAFLSILFTGKQSLRVFPKSFFC